MVSSEKRPLYETKAYLKFFSRNLPARELYVVLGTVRPSVRP